MSPDDRHKCHVLRTSLDQGGGATKRSMYWLLDQVDKLEREIKNKDALLQQDAKKIASLEQRLEGFKDQVLESIAEL